MQRHAEGVISVTFKSPEEGDACVSALKGRWFAKRQINAETYDGKTQYDVRETDAEKEERLRGWEKFLGDEPQSAEKREAQEQANNPENSANVDVADSVAASGASSAASDSGGGDTSRLPSQTAPSASVSATDSETGAADAVTPDDDSPES